MKKLLNYSYLFFIGAAVVLSSCKKEEDPLPINANKLFETKMYATNFGSTGDAIVVGTVSPGDTGVAIRLNVTHSGSNNLSKIYIMKSVDNDAFAPLGVTGSLSSVDSKVFTGNSSSYTLDVPSGTKSFVLDIPIDIRTNLGAVTDVYQIWITDGAGGFNKPTKNRVLGPATVTLKYSASASSATFATATLNLGSQSSADYESFLVTSGQISALNTTDYNEAPASADIRFVTLNSSGKKDNTTSNIYFYSPANVNDANPAGDGSANFTFYTNANPLLASRTTKLMAYSGGVAFESVTASTLSGLSVTSGTNVQLTVGNIYAFETAEGKKGLIKVNSTGAGTPVSGQTAARNVNISIKVLN